MNIELIGAHYTKAGEEQFALGDFSITYTKNFYNKNFLDSGFQGVSPSLKLILPTGNESYSGIFDHWSVEPSLYYSWLFKNEKFFIGNRWRISVPLINVKSEPEPPIFIRFEPPFGYESTK